MAAKAIAASYAVPGGDAAAAVRSAELLANAILGTKAQYVSIGGAGLGASIPVQPKP